MTSPKSVRLKDRDYDVTPYIIAHMYPQISNGSAKVCEVYCGYCRRRVRGEDGRRRVARGLGRGENVGCSVECDTECTMVTSGGDI